MIPKHETLEGKVAIVTGGGGVLCGAMAKELARHGVKVAVVNRTLAKAQDVVEEITNNGDDAIAVQCDVLDKDSIIEADQEIRKHYNKYDILINGAGGNHPKASTSKEEFSLEQLEDDTTTFFDLTEDGIRHVFDLNYMGAILSTQVFMKNMLDQDGATVINISSMSAPSPMTKVMSYSAAKASIENFTQWLSVYMAKSGIRCNAIAPGFFLTTQNEKLLLDEDGSLTSRSEKIMSQTPMDRFGDPDDLLGTLIWLADNQMSRFVTGVTVPVDGGFMAYSGV